VPLIQSQGGMPSTHPGLSARAADRRFVEPPSGADPDHPPYEGGAAAVRGGMVPLPRFELGTSSTRATCCCQVELEGIAYAGRDSNPHTMAFEAASFAC
jgi:hypothetical protein